ncbi:MAG: hypothetical protein HFI38_08170 [Lachnospiraceae bacterium]|jgi:hypothetical protein|nr:hypothetical protein [Lachnospiraceae bacterium]
MKRKQWILAIAATLLIAGAGIGSAMAYFTTYVTAEGGKTLHLGDSTTIREEFDSWQKRVVIVSDPESEPVWVRAVAFAGDIYVLNYSSADESWTRGEDGYYYYNTILSGGESTKELLVKIEGVPEDAKDFNVVVVYECTPVRYDADGAPLEADWSRKVQIDGVREGTNENREEGGQS